MSERRVIATAAAIVMLGNVTSRLLGVVRELVIADRFGATAATSAFVAASTVPTMVYDLLIGGAISAALVPVFSEYVAAGKEDEPSRPPESQGREDKPSRPLESKGREDELRRAAGTVMALVTLLLAGAALLLAAVAPALVAVLVPGLDPALQEQTVALTRLALPAVVFLGLSGVTTALLNSRQVFSYPAFSVAMYNLGIIGCALFFAFSMGITSLVIGVLLGAILHLSLQLPALRRGSPVFAFDLRHPAVVRILRLYAPVALGLVVSQIGVVIDRNLASRTGDDSLAVLRFATTLVQFPVGLVVTATSTAILPTLSRHAAAPNTLAMEPRRVTIAQDDGSTGRSSRQSNASRRESGPYTRTLVMGLRMALLAIIPLTLLMIFERESLVRLLFQRGAFDTVATQRTALAFLYYAPQLPFVAIDLLLIAAFYARQNTRIPTLVGMAAVLVYLVAGVGLIQVMGMAGLALANTIQHTFHSLVLLALIWQSVGGLRGYGLGWTIGKSLIVSLAISGIWWPIAPSLASAFGTGQTVGLAAYLLVAGIVWSVGYCGLLYIWNVTEIRALWGVVHSKTARSAT